MLTDLASKLVDVDRDVLVFVGVVLVAFAVALISHKLAWIVLVVGVVLFHAPMARALPKVIAKASEVGSVTTKVTTSVTDVEVSHVVRNACDTLTPEQVASVLYVAGFRGDDLVHLVAIGKRESGYRPAAHRSDRPKSEVMGDRGLFQINYIHDANLRAAGIISSPSDLFDPLVNARAARFLFERSGLFPWNMTAGGWQAHGVPFHGTNVERAREAVQRAEQQGLLTGDLAEFERQTAACGTEVQ